jgi:hypothetical protein
MEGAVIVLVRVFLNKTATFVKTVTYQAHVFHLLSLVNDFED